jgi:electron transfer flavoprotein alpha subunit
MGHHDAFLAPATANGKNIAPRVAALLDVMQVSEILTVESEDTFTRPTYAGNAIATVQSTDAKKVITVRATGFEKAAREGGSGVVEAVSGKGDCGLSSFVGAEIAKSERPELTSRKIIVSGGRALQNSENFHSIIEPLADKLGAASAPAARRSMRAMCPTTIRSARPARSSLRKSISRSASRARSSISRA